MWGNLHRLVPFSDIRTMPPGTTLAPYKIQKRGNKFVVVNNAGETKASFDDREKALAYQRALYVNVKGAAKKADRVKFTGKAKPPKTDRADANFEDWAAEKCTCGRLFATPDGYQAHFVALHDAEPDPVENAKNDAELQDAAAQVKKGDRDKGGMSDGSYPITNQAQANSAWKLRGHSKNHSEAEVVAHIRRRVKALGLKMPGGQDSACCDRTFGTDMAYLTHVKIVHEFTI
jgi:hypothetical protein